MCSILCTKPLTVPLIVRVNSTAGIRFQIFIRHLQKQISILLKVRKKRQSFIEENNKSSEVFGESVYVIITELT